MEPIKVLLVDDHQLVLDGIKSMLNGADMITIIGEAQTAQNTQKFLENHQPDVILMDINLPEMNGVELCGIVKKAYPSIQIIALTMLNEVSFITRIMKAGASGYLLKNTSKDEIIKAIKTVTSGDQYLTQEVKEHLISASFGQRTHQSQPKLTRREKEVLALVMEENTTKEIAEKLFISMATVETHRLHLLNKIGARNTAGLVKKAIELGLA